MGRSEPQRSQPRRAATPEWHHTTWGGSLPRVTVPYGGGTPNGHSAVWGGAPPPSRSTTGDDAPLGQRSGAAPAGIHAPGVTQWLVSAGGERGRSLSITASKLRMNIMTAPSSFFTGTTSTRHRKQLPADGGGGRGETEALGGLGGVGYPRPLPHRAPPRPGAAPSPALLSGRGPRSAPPLRSDWAVSVCVCRGGVGLSPPHRRPNPGRSPTPTPPSGPSLTVRRAGPPRPAGAAPFGTARSGGDA